VFDRVMTNTWTFRRAVSVRVDGDTVAAYPAPPSSFGPYGLMRLAAATGGHYGIWGWNPLPRKGWVYDYGRCNRFAPDLRSRAEILADLQHRHLPRALLKAWHLVSSGACQFAAFPPPWDPVTFEPRARERVHGSGLPNPWRNASARDAFFRGMRGRLRSLDEAIGILDVAIARAGGKDTVDDRYRADAELMRHILRLYRFANAERREAYLMWEREASSEIPRDELTYQPHHWVSGGPAPERLRMSENRPYQTGRALEILRQHREFLTRFQGTPYAWVVSCNEIDTYRIVKQRRSASGRGGKANDSSRGRTPVTPGPGGSRGDGPTTGP
jgi:hypothetical protein